MDQSGLNPARHTLALNGLARLNRFSRSVSLLWSAINRLPQQGSNEPLSILDVASGGGDVTWGVWRRARRAGRAVRITGFDRSPLALEMARGRSSSTPDVRFEQRDVFSSNDWGRHDVVMASLFLHHLDDRRAVELLGRMAAAARRLVIVNDLERSTLSYWAVHAAGRLFSRSDIVHHDGPLSVRAAFSAGELERLAHRAGLHHARATRHWPFRVRLVWTPPGDRPEG